MLKLLLDENISYQYKPLLEKLGYDVLHISDQSPGIIDDEVIVLAIQTDRILITQDTDFVRMIFRYQYRVTRTLCLLRKGTLTKRELFDELVSWLSGWDEGTPSIVVLSRGICRVRQL